MAADPMAGAVDPGMGADTDTGSDSNVLVTITGEAGGPYTVYAGDEPEGGGDDMSSDDDAASVAGGAPGGSADIGGGAASGGDTSGGQPAATVGAALKLAMDILSGGGSASGGPSAQDNFDAGFGGGKPSGPKGL